jgi:hypothetical protein
MSLAGVTASKFVGGRQDLSADGHQGETVPVTDGEVAGRHRLARPPPIADYSAQCWKASARMWASLCAARFRLHRGPWATPRDIRGTKRCAASRRRSNVRLHGRPGTGERPEGARCGVEDHVCRCLGRCDGDRVRSARDLAASVRQLSPGSGANPVTYTSALISPASASTFEITAPP